MGREISILEVIGGLIGFSILSIALLSWAMVKINQAPCPTNHIDPNDPVCIATRKILEDIRIPSAFHLSFVTLLFFCSSIMLFVVWKHSKKNESPFAHLAEEHIEGEF